MDLFNKFGDFLKSAGEALPPAGDAVELGRERLNELDIATHEISQALYSDLNDIWSEEDSMGVAAVAGEVAVEQAPEAQQIQPGAINAAEQFVQAAPINTQQAMIEDKLEAVYRIQNELEAA